MSLVVLQGLLSKLIVTQGFGPNRPTPGCVHTYDIALYTVIVSDSSC